MKGTMCDFQDFGLTWKCQKIFPCGCTKTKINVVWNFSYTQCICPAKMRPKIWKSHIVKGPPSARGRICFGDFSTLSGWVRTWERWIRNANFFCSYRYVVCTIHILAQSRFFKAFELVNKCIAASLHQSSISQHIIQRFTKQVCVWCCLLTTTKTRHFL